MRPGHTVDTVINKPLILLENNNNAVIDAGGRGGEYCKRRGGANPSLTNRGRQVHNFSASAQQMFTVTVSTKMRHRKT
jgi:hypothetical protein